jgi:hypothetical protein
VPQPSATPTAASNAAALRRISAYSAGSVRASQHPLRAYSAYSVGIMQARHWANAVRATADATALRDVRGAGLPTVGSQRHATGVALKRQAAIRRRRLISGVLRQLRQASMP